MTGNFDAVLDDPDLILEDKVESFRHLARESEQKKRHAASFRVAMTSRTRRMKKLGRHTCPEWMLWDKSEGARFASYIGLRHAEKIDQCDHRALRFQPGTVIKPDNESQSLGVYLILSEDRIRHACRAHFRGHRNRPC